MTVNRMLHLQGKVLFETLPRAVDVLETGATEIAPLRACQPWPEGRHAEAFRRA
jgi:hypothetical protein